MDIERSLQEFPLTLWQIGQLEDGSNTTAIATLELIPEEGLRLFNLTHDLYFRPIDTEQSFLTSQGQHVRLFRHEDLEAVLPEYISQEYWQFDYGLHSDKNWPEGPLLFDRWALPCDALLAYLKESALNAGWPNGVRTIELQDASIFEFDIPLWNARIALVKASTWEVRLYETSTITARSHFKIDYESPVELETIRQHEDALRHFMTWIWKVWFHTPKLPLWNGKRHTALYRSDHRGQDPQIAVRHSFSKQHIKERFALWFNAWLTIDADEMRVIRQVSTVYSNDGLSIDLKFVMTYEAVAAMGKIKGQADTDGLIARYWAMGEEMEPTAAKKLGEHLRFTRNEILHLRPDERAEEGQILYGKERTRALSRLDAVFRAMVLERIGEPDDDVRAYLRRLFKDTETMPLRYY